MLMAFNFFVDVAMKHGDDAAVNVFSCNALLHKLFIMKVLLICINVGLMSQPESK
jgi:hypothetical protein